MRQSELPHVHTVTLHVVLDSFRIREALVITKIGTGKKWLRIEDWHIMWYLHGGTRFRLEDWRDQEWHWLANGIKESLIVGAILCMQRRALTEQEMLQITKLMAPGVAHRYAIFLLKYSIGWRPKKDSIEKRPDWEKTRLRKDPIEKRPDWEKTRLRKDPIEKRSDWEKIRLRKDQIEKRSDWVGGEEIGLCHQTWLWQGRHSPFFNNSLFWPPGFDHLDCPALLL